MSETTAKRPDYLVLVNEKNRLPDGFEETVELVSGKNCVGDQFVIEKKTYEAFCRLQEDLLKNDGIETVLFEAHRTVKRQEETFEGFIKAFGLDYAKKYVAIPGCSEHHTGLAVDVGILSEGKLYRTHEEIFSIPHLYKTVHEKLPKYGFILRYPASKESVTKISYEPWHFRYIDSPEIAQEITDKGISFEEYWQTL